MLVGEVVRDAPTCTTDDRAGGVLERLDGSPVSFAVVTTDGGVVVGKLLARHAGAEPDAAAGDLMIEGPTTVRASEEPTELAHRMEHAGTSSVLVTTKEGILLGVALRADLEDVR